MENKDRVRLSHMMDSVEAILSFAKGRKRADLESDRQFLSALLRELEVIGEAASRISKRTQREFSEIPWKDIIGMRNRLIHAYFDIDHDVVWNTVRDYLPSFRKQLEQVMHSPSFLHREEDVF